MVNLPFYCVQIFLVYLNKKINIKSQLTYAIIYDTNKHKNMFIYIQVFFYNRVPESPTEHWLKRLKIKTLKVVVMVENTDFCCKIE